MKLVLAVLSAAVALALQVQIKNGTVIGSSKGGVDAFLGIPFAKPPTGHLRLKPPQPIDSLLGTINATTVPTACPQLLSVATASTPAAASTAPEGEDCLTLNVYRPADIPSGKKLPIMFWIYGGGFQVSSTQTFNATALVRKSQALNNPMVHVAVNYRGGGFGFLAGKQLQRDHSTNLGLRDQRAGLHWVAENIGAFGGDPDKVTIFGESAGSISVYYHLLINGGDHRYRGRPLFRGAIMDSGSIFPVTDVDSAKPQEIYNTISREAGCACMNSLSCLRSLPYDKFHKAVNAVPSYLSYRGSLDLSFLPRPDCTDRFFSEHPEVATAKGHFARVPAIIGDQEDEGTMFALPLSNLTTTDALVGYLSSIFQQATKSQVQKLVDLYPTDPAAGSPFGTGSANQVFPQFKRIAALLGDFKFIMMRRAVLATMSRLAPHTPWWSYLGTYGHGTPKMGTQHGSDVLEVYSGLPEVEVGEAIMTYYISFVNHLDPNAIKPAVRWPQWTERHPSLLNISQSSNEVIPDTFRWPSYVFLRDYYSDFRL